MIHLAQIGQIALTVRDLKRATEFYRDTLGIRFLFEIPDAVFFDCGGVRLMLGLAEEAKPDVFSSILYYKVADILVSYEMLLQQGVEFVQKPHFVAPLGTHDLWLAFFRDSEGNMLALMSEIPKP